MSDVIGWDIGGAHIKAARVDRNGTVLAVAQIPCALWHGLAQLHTALDAVSDKIGGAKRHVATMTGEMVDLFVNREVGVATIANALREHFSDTTLYFYAGGDQFVSFASVRENVARIASANWRAPIQLLAGKVSDALFIDIGSTTTDLIAIVDSRPQIKGHDDFTRLVTGELVYSGVVRTPLMALTEQIAFRGESVPLMAELFATTADVYRLTNELPPNADQHPTADGKEKSMLASARRMARMIGCDVESATMEEWRNMAVAFRASQVQKLQTALDKVASLPGLGDNAAIIAAGVGQFLVHSIADSTGLVYRSFGDFIHCVGVDRIAVANAAPAAAVALLGLQQCFG